MEQTKETYWSRFADDFEERNYYVAGKDDMEIILNKVDTINNLNNVLELGCGNGTYSKRLAKRATSLVATDFSEEMVEASKERLKKIKNIKVEKADCFHLPYLDNTFDTVFMANLIHIIPNPDKAIIEAKRVLKHGGSIIVLSFTQKGMSFYNKLGMIYRYLKTYGKPPKNGRSLGLKDAIKLIQMQGLEIIESELLGDKTKALFIKSRIDEEAKSIVTNNEVVY